MWNRATLKENAKYNFKRLYWTTVGACVLASLLGCSGSGGVSFDFNAGDAKSIEKYIDSIKEDIKEENYDEYDYDDYDSDYDNNNYYEDNSDDSAEFLSNTKTSIKAEDMSYSNTTLDDYSDYSENDLRYVEKIFGMGISIIIIVILIATVCIFVFRIFVSLPTEVGYNKLFIKVRTGKASISDMFFMFSNKKYMNSIGTLLLRDIYTFLWSLLFFIPGIIKAYEYRMVPLILAENPDIKHERAFELSKKMMYGNKMDAFVFDLSFFGWYLLSFITCGILAIFYVNPYKKAADIELYEVLRRDVLGSYFARFEELGRPEDLATPTPGTTQLI